MQCDTELLTKILLALEADEPVGDVSQLAYLDEDWQVVNGHLSLLAERNMIRGSQFGSTNVDASEWPWHNISLKSAGHDALAATRTNKAGEWWKAQFKAFGKLTTPALIAQVASHPEEFRKAVEAIDAFLRSL